MSDEQDLDPTLNSTGEPDTGAAGEADTGDDEGDDALLASQERTDEKGNRYVPMPLATVSHLRKSARELKSQLRAATEARDKIQQDVDRVAPLVNALLGNPQLRAQAIQAARGGQAPQAGAGDGATDQEAIDHATDMGWYQQDGFTPDAARARRVLDRLGGITDRRVKEAVAPIAGIVAGSRADQNIRTLIAATDSSGVPLASEASIREVAQMIGPELLANEQVLQVAQLTAMGMDRQKGRTPSLPSEPLYLEGSRGRARGPVITSEDRAMMQRAGISEKEYTQATQALNNIGRGGIALE